MIEVMPYVRRLYKLFHDWDELYNGYGTSSWYPDGYLCNQIRKEIIEVKDSIDKLNSLDRLPAICDRKIPVKVPDTQMFNNRKLLHNGIQPKSNDDVKDTVAEDKSEEYSQISLEL